MSAAGIFLRCNEQDFQLYGSYCHAYKINVWKKQAPNANEDLLSSLSQISCQ